MKFLNTHILFDAENIARPHPSRAATLVGDRRVVGARPASPLHQRGQMRRCKAPLIKFAKSSKQLFVLSITMFNVSVSVQRSSRNF
jgi:hypothetical protein